MENRLKILYLNATELVDYNPGCQATSALLQNNLNGDIINRLPLGFGYHLFTKKRKLFNSEERDFRIKQKSLFENKDYTYLFKIVDVVVINAEGTIHSDSIGAKTLLAFSNLAKKLKKKVYIVNGSFYKLSEYLLRILRNSDKIYVREKASYEYLLENNVKSKLVFDCAFLVDKISGIKKDETKCLYTPGTLFLHGDKHNDKHEILKNHYLSLKKIGLTPIFGIAEKKEIEYAQYWQTLGGHYIDLTTQSLDKVQETIAEFSYVLSGRYHILLFALLQGSKTKQIESNTDKIIGLYKNFDIDIKDSLINLNDKVLSLHSFKQVNLNLHKIQSEIKNSYVELFN